jgi:hypothetical protein
MSQEQVSLEGTRGARIFEPERGTCGGEPRRSVLTRVAIESTSGAAEQAEPPKVRV